MSDKQATSSGSRAKAAEPTGWLGWIFFAAVMMVMIGIFHVIQGFVALFKDSYYVVAKSGLVVQLDYTQWGWVHIFWGALILIAGLALMSGQMWARVVGIVLAVVSFFANAAFLAAYPIWSIIIMTMDVLVIYALTVHGREAKVDY